MKYPVSESLKKAIELLFDDPSIGLETVGALRIMPPEWYQEARSKTIPIQIRAKMLRKCLEDNISNMAIESKEYDSHEETERLRAEALSTLISLRELFLHIPEAFDN